jgi:hypothetical protein
VYAQTWLAAKTTAIGAAAKTRKRGLCMVKLLTT